MTRVLLTTTVVILGSCSDPAPVPPPPDAAAREASAQEASAREASMDRSRADAVVDAPRPGPDAAIGNPGAAGSHQVFRQDPVTIPVAGGRTASATLCAPSSDGKTIAAGSFPLVVLSPGFSLERKQVDSYCRHLASWGFLVVLRDYSELAIFINHEHQAEDVKAIIDWAAKAGTPLAASLDATRIGTAGHSLGGKLSVLAAIRDPRIKAAVGWDPVDANAPSVAPELMAGLKVPLAVLGETLDGQGGLQPCAPAADNYTQFYAAAASPALEVTLEGADHMDWVDDPACLLCGFCQKGTASDAEVKRITRMVTTAFLRRHLLGETAMESYLTGAAIQAEVSAKRATIRNK